MHADYSCWLRVTRDWQGGAALYRETYDNKSPWLYRWVRAIDSANPNVSVYLVESLMAATGATVLWVALRPVFPRVAFLAPLLLIVWSGTSETFYGGQTTEAFALWLDVTMVASAALAARRGSLVLAATCGGCLFLAAVLRPPAFLHSIACLPFVWLLWQRYPAKCAVQVLASACAGAVVLLGLFFLDAVAGGFGRDFLTVLETNRQYGSLASVPPATLALTTATTLARIMLGNAGALLLVAVSAVVCWRSSHFAARERLVWCGAVLLWLIAAVVSTLPGGRSYAHYFHFLWAPISILAVMWMVPLVRLETSNALRQRLILGIMAGTLLVAGLQQGYRAAKVLRDSPLREQGRTQLEAAVEYLNRNVPPQTPTLVNVWGDWAELYWRVPRPAPSFSIPHVLPRDLFDTWAEATLAQPPDLVVWDGTPWQAVDGASEPQLIARLEDMLHGNYELAERFGNLVVLRRKPRS